MLISSRPLGPTTTLIQLVAQPVMINWELWVWWPGRHWHPPDFAARYPSAAVAGPWQAAAHLLDPVLGVPARVEAVVGLPDHVIPGAADPGRGVAGTTAAHHWALAGGQINNYYY